MTRRRTIAPLMVTTAIVVTALGASTGAQLTLALMTGSAAVSGNTFTTGTWAATATTWYLHNNPTPPVANTVAQFNLPLNATVPTATTLRNYDTNCDTTNGRSIRRGAGAVSETATCFYATWRSTALPTARLLTGTATLTVWARKLSTSAANPTMRGYLRVFDPMSATYVALGSRDIAVTTTAWAAYALTVPLATAMVPVGRQIEVKIVALGNTGAPDFRIAYDQSTRRSNLQLP